MNRLIIGCGYLGSRIASLWQQQRHRVFATTRKPLRAEELARQKIEPILCDVLDPASLARLPSVDAVVYCVGLDRSAGVSMREVYVKGLGNVLDALPGWPRFVQVSSTGVYGQTAGEEVDEDAATEPCEESGQIVFEAERLLRRRVPDAIVLRFAGIYGPGRLLRRASALRAGAPFATDPDVWLNLIHVEDGTLAVDIALTRAEPGKVYNVSDGRPVRRREFYTRLAEMLQVPAPGFIPREPSRESNRRIINARLRGLGMDFRYPSYVQGLPASLGEDSREGPLRTPVQP
jgi:nucleoside-diphosphate-sugar epimerase